MTSAREIFAHRGLRHRFPIALLQHLQLRQRCAVSHARFDPRRHITRAREPRLWLRRIGRPLKRLHEHRRYADFLETPRQHPNYSVNPPRQSDFLADDVLISAKLFFPKGLRQHDDCIASRHAFFRSEKSPHQRLHT